MTSQCEKLALSISELAAHLGIGMNNAYALVHREGFPAIWLTPKKCIVPVDGLREWLRQEGGRDNG